MKLYLRAGVFAVLTTSLLPGDVTYTQATKFEGGTLVDMMQKMASMPLMGRMMSGSRQAFEDQTYDVYIKGNKMARWGKVTSIIYDLDAGSITTINHAKKTYTTTTFEDMQQKMEQAQQHMKQQQGPALDFDVKVNATGQTKSIDGVTAKEVVMTMTAKQANAQGQMVVTTHSWLVPYGAASQEAVDFHRKLGQKYAFAMAGPGMAGAGQGMSAAINQAYKQEGGYPAEMEMVITGVTAPTGPMGGSGDPSAPLLKELIQTQNFAKGSVDDSKFMVPDGFKEDKKGR
jgi:hypothetical protein